MTKLNVTDVCHVAASMASGMDSDDDVAGDVDHDGPLISRPIFELGQSVGPFFDPLSNESPPNRPIKN